MKVAVGAGVFNGAPVFFNLTAVVAMLALVAVEFFFGFANAFFAVIITVTSEGDGGGGSDECQGQNDRSCFTN